MFFDQFDEPYFFFDVEAAMVRRVRLEETGIGIRFKLIQGDLSLEQESLKVNCVGKRAGEALARKPYLNDDARRYGSTVIMGDESASLIREGSQVSGS